MFDKEQLYQQHQEALQTEFKNLQDTLNLQPKKAASQILKIHTENFNQIIDIDSKNFTIEVEGMASYDKIVTETLKLNCLPPIIPSSRQMTVNDSISTCLTSSSSFRFGFIQESVLKVDVMTGTGFYSYSSKDDQKDLFLALPNSGKTLGIVLKATLPLIPIKKYVRLSQFYFSDFNTFIKNLLEFSMENREVGSLSFLEGVIVDKNEMVISIGEMVDQGRESGHRLNDYIDNLRRSHDFNLVLSDYLWRWDPQKNENNKRNWIESYWNFFNIFRQKTSWLNLEGITSVSEIEKLYEILRSNLDLCPLKIYPISPYSSLNFSFFPIDASQVYFNFKPVNLIANNKRNRRILAKMKSNSCFFPVSQYSFAEDEFVKKYPIYQKLKHQYDPHNIIANCHIIPGK